MDFSIRQPEFKEKSILFVLTILSFLLFLVSLSKYDISYGIDGPYYNIQIRDILRTGFPNSNDPPFVYYYLLPFTLIFGSFQGIKVGMALIGAITLIPTYYIVKDLLGSTSKLNKELGFLAAVLVVCNWFTLRMIGEFIQNYAGVVFLLIFIYASPKWMMDLSNKKYCYLTISSVLLALLTHLYIAALILSLITLTVLSRIYFSYKTDQSFQFHWKKEHLWISVLILLTLIAYAITAILIPSTLETYSKVTSFFSSMFSGGQQGNYAGIVFLSIPYIAGLFLSLKLQNDQLKTKNLGNFITYSQILGLSLIILSLTLPIISGTWSSRFVLLAFLPIALVVPIALTYVENYPSGSWSGTRMKTITRVIIVIFIITSVISSMSYSSSMSPSITDAQYDELVYMSKLDINHDGIILNSVLGIRYWIQYIFDMSVSSATNYTRFILNHPNLDLYIIVSTNATTPKTSGQNRISVNIFLPYSFQLGSSTQNNAINNQGPPALPNQGRNPGFNQYQDPFPNQGPIQGNQIDLSQATVMYKGEYFALYIV